MTLDYEYDPPTYWPFWHAEQGCVEPITRPWERPNPPTVTTAQDYYDAAERHRILCGCNHVGVRGP